MAGKTVKASIIIGGALASSLRSALHTTQDGLKQIGEAIANVDRRKRLLANSIDTFGRMGKDVSKLRAEYAGLSRESDRLRAAQQRLANVQERIEANNRRRDAIGGRARGAVAGVGAVAAATFFPVRQAVEFETAMLGVAKQVDGARDANGKLTSIYFDMGRQIQKLGHELPMATNEIADMVTAGARMGIARDDLIGFTRDAAMMATAFEAPAGELADNMGKIAQIFRIPIRNIGELGDAINYLDDNAISKGSDIIKVMQGDLAGAATTMGLSAKNAAALASTFLTLGESAERADTAASGMLRQLQIAKMNPKRFQIGVEMIGMTGDQLQKGMIKDAQGTILDVLDRIKKLPQEKQMEAVTRLFGKDWGGAIAKLANGVDEYKRQLELANGEAAKGSMSREFQARMGTTAAQWQIMKNRVTELSVAIGSALLPPLNDLLKTATPIVDKFAAWAKENPGMVKGIVGAAFAMTGLRAATLGAAYAWTVVKTPILSVMGFVARFRAGAAVAQLGRIGSIGMRIVSVFRTIATVVGALGAGPIAALVGAVVIAGLVIRKYWQPIGAWISGVFKGIGTAMAPVFNEMGSALSALKPAWDAVSSAVGAVWNWIIRLLEPVNMTSAQLQGASEAGQSFGQVIGAVMGFAVQSVTAVVKAVTWIGEAIGNTAGFIVVNFGQAWEQVKATVGAAADWIMQKLEPILKAGRVVGDAVRKAANAVGFGEEDGEGNQAGGLIPPVRGKEPPPMPQPAQRGGAASVSVQQQNTFHITQQPGESADDLARRIAREQEQREAVKRRGSLVDVGA